MTYKAKPRCKWRGRHIAWCRKYGKFCDPPREYEYCLGYEPVERLHETLPFAKVSHNIRVLRSQILPAGTKEPLNPERGWEEAFPETLKLKPLFDMQDSLIEHRFPHERTMVMDNVISCAGDIYREMTHAYPDYSYVGEKWGRLTTWSAKPPLSWLQTGDWEEIRNEIQNPSYKALRDQYLNNLQRLREETVKMPMDPKRSAVMTESLDTIKALIFWFESQDPYAPPRWQLDRLTDAIYNYFPREFFKSSWVQIPPWQRPLRIYALDEVRLEIRQAHRFYEKRDVENALRHVRNAEDDLDMVLHSVPPVLSQAEYESVKREIENIRSLMQAGKSIDDTVAEFDGKVWGLVWAKYGIQIPPEIRERKLEDDRSMYNISVSSTEELKSHFGSELRQMISEAESQKREVGAMLCRTAAGQPHLSRACYGRRETVTVADCHNGLSPLGSFHVHLGGTDVFSVPDLELAIKKEQLSCLGYAKTGQSYLKCINPRLYQQLHYKTKIEIKQSLDQARQDIERANQLFRTSPSNPEARLLSQRAQATLRNIEAHLEAYEVPL